MFEKLKKWANKNKSEIEAIKTLASGAKMMITGNPTSALQNTIEMTQRFPVSKGGYTILYDMEYSFGPCPYCGHTTYCVKENPYMYGAQIIRPFSMLISQDGKRDKRICQISTTKFSR